jgi:molybdate transport system substrate-binding protein
MSRMNFFNRLTISFLLLLTACTALRDNLLAPAGANQFEHTLTIFAAASLTESFTQVGDSFESSNPGAHVLISFAGSQQLAQQLALGAPADVFASANLMQMQAAIKSGRIAADSVKEFAYNHLVVVFPKDSTNPPSTLQELAKPGLKLVLAAKEVPVGQYSQQFLERASADPNFDPQYKSKVLKNVVSYEENVRAVLSKVILGEADAGIVYQSDINPNQARLGQLNIPQALNVQAAYFIAPIEDSPHASLSQAFIDWTLSAESQATLARYGFAPIVTHE